MIVYRVKNGNIHFSYGLDDGLLVKYLVIKKSKLKILHRNCPKRMFSGNCPSKGRVGRFLAKSLDPVVILSFMMIRKAVPVLILL